MTNKLLHFALLPVVLAVVAFSASCSSDHDDDTPSNGKISLNLASVDLGAESGAMASFSITTKGAWNISGVESWFRVSPSTSGTGDQVISVIAKEANSTASTRTATLKVYNSKYSAEIQVMQEPGLNSCRAKPTNITPLYNRVAYGIQLSSDVFTYKVMMWDDYTVTHTTTPEILEALEEGESYNNTDETIFFPYCDEGLVKYHIFTVAYDTNGNRGEMLDTQFTSPEKPSLNDAAYCEVSGGWTNEECYFTVEKQGRCDSYHMIYGGNVPSYDVSNGALMAYEINYYLNNGKKNWYSSKHGLNIETNYPNDHTFYYKRNPSSDYQGICGWAWGVLKDGTISPQIYGAGESYAQKAPQKGVNRNRSIDYGGKMPHVGKSDLGL